MGTMRRRAGKFFRRMNCLRCTAAEVDDEATSAPRDLATTTSWDGHTRSSPAGGSEAWAQTVDHAKREPFEAEGPRRPHILPCGHSLSRETLQAVLECPPQGRRCPQCGAGLPPRSVDDFPLNFGVIQFLRDRNETSDGCKPAPGAQPCYPGCCGCCHGSRSRACGTYVQPHETTAAATKAAPAAAESVEAWSWLPWGPFASWWGGGEQAQQQQAKQMTPSARSAAAQPGDLRAAGTQQQQQMQAPEVKLDDVLTGVSVGVAAIAVAVMVGARLLRG